MPIRAQLFDGTFLEFPDGTSPDVINSTAKRMTDEIRSAKAPERTAGDVAKDIGVTALKGAVGLPQAFAGLADIPTGGAVSRGLESVGIRFGEAQKALEGMYSPAQKAALERVQKAEGFIPTALAAIQNPSVPLAIAGQSIPQMLGGAGIARQLVARGISPLIGAAAGEGAIGAGAAAAEMREASPEGQLSAKQALAALGSGVMTGALGVAGGKAARALGLDDIDTLIARGGTGAAEAAAAKSGYLKAIAGSGLTEGFLEEMPQSAQEQMWKNWSADKPLLEGVPEAAALGAVVGAGFGAVGGAAGRYARQAEPQQSDFDRRRAEIEGGAPTPTPFDEASPLENPYGNIPAADIGDVAAQINEARSKRKQAPLQSFSVEDIVESGLPAEQTDQLLSAALTKSGFDPAQAVEPQDIMDAAAERGLDTEQPGFRDFLRRSSGAENPEQMTPVQRVAAFGAIQSLPEGVDSLPIGTNAQRFTEPQYKAGLKAIRGAVSGGASRDNVISAIQKAGVPDIRDAQSIFQNAIKGGEVSAVSTSTFTVIDDFGKPVRSYDSREQAEQLAGRLNGQVQESSMTKFVSPELAGGDIRPGSYRDEPTGFEIRAGDTVLRRADTAEDAEAAAERLQQIRSRLASNLNTQVEGIREQLANSNQPLEVLEAQGLADTPQYAKLKKQTDKTIQDLTKKRDNLFKQIADFSRPLHVGAAAPKPVGKKGFTRFEGGRPVEYLSSLGALPKPTTGPVTDQDIANIDALRKKLLPTLKRFGLEGIGLRVVKNIEDGGAGADGAYVNRLIQIALSAENPMGVMRHEVIHALKELGAFTAKEWRVLEGKAKSEWIDRFIRGAGTYERYQDAYRQGNGSLEGFDEYIAEEAIAEAFKYFDATKPPPGLVGNLFGRIRNFFVSLRNALQGAGFQTAEEVLGRIEEGKVTPTRAEATAAEPRYSIKSMSKAPDWVPQEIWDLHEKLQRADAEASGEITSVRGKAPGALKRNQTMAFRRLNNAVTKFIENDDERGSKSLALMVRMNQESSRREKEAEDRGAEEPKFSLKRRETELTRGADEIAAMDEDTRGNTSPADMPGGYYAYEYYEALKLQPKPSTKLKKVTENNSNVLWEDQGYIANVDGELFGVTKQEDPDDPDNEEAFVYSFARLADPFKDRRIIETVVSTPEELFDEIRNYMGDELASLDTESFKREMERRFGAPRARAKKTPKFSLEPRILSNGNIVGAPPGARTVEARNKLVKRMTNLLSHPYSLYDDSKEWYERSGATIREITRGNPELTERTVRLMALYSQANSLGANTTATIKSIAQLASGDKTAFAGRFPNTTAERIPALLAAPTMDVSLPGVDDKLMNFYRNLHDATYGVDTFQDASTIDRWMMRLFGYPHAEDQDAGGATGVSSTQYIYAKDLIRRISDANKKRNGEELKPRQVQAVMWTYVKNTTDYNSLAPEKKAKFEPSTVDFSDYITRATANITWESRPSTKLPLIPGIHKASRAEQEDFNRSVREIFIDPKTGTDKIFELLGNQQLYSSQLSIGAYENLIAPNVITKLVLQKDDGDYLTDVANKYAAIIGYVTKQDAVPWYRADPTAGGKDASQGYRVTATNAEANPEFEDRLFKHLNENIPGIGFTRVGNSFDFINFRDTDTGKPYMMSDKQYLDKLQGALESFDKDVKFDVEPFRAKSGWISNDWTENTNGQGYLERFSPAELANIRRDIEGWGKDYDRIAEQYGKEYGWAKFSLAKEQRAAGKPVSGKRVTTDTIEVDGEDRPTRTSKGTLIFPTEEGVRNFWRWFGNSVFVDEDGRPLVMYHGTAADIEEFIPKQANAIFITPNVEFAADFKKGVLGGVATWSEGWMVENYEDILTPEQIERAKLKALSEIDAETKKDYKLTPKSHHSAFVETAEFNQALLDEMPSRANVIPLFVKAENPFNYDNPNHVRQVVARLFLDSGVDLETDPNGLIRFEDKNGSIADKQYSEDEVYKMLSKGYWPLIEQDETQEAIRGLGFDGFSVQESMTKNYAVYDSTQVKSSVGNSGKFSPEKKSIRYSIAQTKTEPFKRFFGESKIVDRNGNPLMMYHATPSPDEEDIFSVFRRSDDGKLGQGIYTTAVERYAESFAPEGAVMPLWVSIENPLYIDLSTSIEKGRSPRDILRAKMDGRERTGEVDYLRLDSSGAKEISDRLNMEIRELTGKRLMDMSGASIRRTLQKAGYDGIVVRDADGNFVEVNAFDKTQVKSAVGNRGTFKGKDIRYSISSSRELFDPKEIEKHSHTPNKGRTKLIDMNIDDFLRLATPGYVKSKEADVEKALNSGEKLREFPSIVAYQDDGKGDLIVDGNNDPRHEGINNHEGRHRARALKKRGYTTMPVMLTTNIRFSEQQDPEKFDYIEDWPKKIIGYNGNTAAFPVKREDADKDYQTPDKSDIRYSLEKDIKGKAGLGQDAVDEIKRTTAKREEEGFFSRFISSISPEGIEKFRALYIQRYQALERNTKAVADRFGESRLLADQSAIAAALMSHRAAGIAGQSYLNGVPVYEKGYTRVDDLGGKVKGLIPIFQPLMKYNDPFVFQAFQFYGATRRGARLFKEGREKLLTPQDIRFGKLLEKEYPEFKQVFDEYQKYNRGLVKFLVDTGVLTEEMGRKWTMYADYIPFYRQADGEETLGPKLFHNLSGVQPTKKLKGGEFKLDDFLETVVRNTKSAVEQGMKNIAAQRAVNEAMMLNAPGQFDYAKKLPAGSAGGPDIVNVRENGVDVKYKVVDPMWVEAMKGLYAQNPYEDLLKIVGFPTRMLRNIVTKMPDFMVANLLRDSMSAWVTSGSDFKPIIDTFKQAGKELAGGSPEARLLRAAGVATGYEFAGDVKASAKEFSKELRALAGKRTTAEKVMLPLDAAWNLLEKGSNLSDIATRAEVARRTLAETGNEAEAVFRAIEVMNFDRMGSSLLVQVMAAITPFFNARVQGLDLLYRAGMGELAQANRKAAHKAFMIRATTLIALSAVYWMLASDTDDYKKANEETRDNNWIIGPVKLPIPYEIGVLFKVIPERIMGYFFGTDTGKDVKDAAVRQVTSTLGINPVPQAILPILENAVDYSFFTARPVIPKGMEDVAPQFQATSTTSLVAQKIGQATGTSPIKIDNLINGYFGALGSYSALAIDSMLRTTSDPVKPTMRLDQMPVIRRFLTATESQGTVGAFYDLKDAVDEVTRTSNFLLNAGRYDQYAAYMKENGKLFEIKPLVQHLDKDLTSLSERENQIRGLGEKDISADEKQAALNAIREARNNLTAKIREVRKKL